jgi:hypothetical protein
VPAGVKTFRQPVRRQVSVSMSISGTTPHRARIAVFSRRRFRGSGAASSGVRRIAPALRRSAICSQARPVPPSASFSTDSSASSSSRISPVNRLGSSGLRSRA